MSTAIFERLNARGVDTLLLERKVALLKETKALRNLLRVSLMSESALVKDMEQAENELVASLQPQPVATTATSKKK